MPKPSDRERDRDELLISVAKGVEMLLQHQAGIGNPNAMAQHSGVIRSQREFLEAHYK